MPIKFYLQKQAVLLVSQQLTAKVHNLLVCLDCCWVMSVQQVLKFLRESDKNKKETNQLQTGSPRKCKYNFLQIISENSQNSRSIQMTPKDDQEILFLMKQLLFDFSFLQSKIHESTVRMDQPTFKLCNPVTNKGFYLIFFLSYYIFFGHYIIILNILISLLFSVYSFY